MVDSLDVLSESDLDDLAELASVVQQSDAELEASLRERWGLPEIDLQAMAIDAGQGSHRMPSADRSDEYSEEEWLLVTSIRKQVEAVLTAASPKNRRTKALRWLFVRGIEDAKGISFHLACEALEARPWVLQALLQHLIYVRGIVLDKLDPMADILPEAIQSEAILAGWDAGLAIANLVWRWPSIPVEVLRASLPFSDEVYEHAFSALTAKGIVTARMGQAYLTSRPPGFRRSGNKISWSKSFIGE